MFITSKRGAQDNIVTYEHICDTTEDLQKIDPHYITLGSTCIVVQGENGGVDAYIATSDKQWVPLGGGSGGSSEEDIKKYENSNVRFIDYDGKVVDGYTAEEFLQLNKMPKNPNHKNDKIPLTAQGWNWSLADIKAYMTKYPDAVMTVGQMYIPTDGKTHMVLDVGPRLTIPLMIQQTVSNGVTINWGDGSEEETIEGTGTVTTSHTYEAEGEYDITLDVADGCTLDFGGTVDNTACNVFGESATRVYISSLMKLYIGDSITSIGNSAFINCYQLINLTIPNGVTIIGNSAFKYAYSLYNIVIPNSVSSVESNAFSSCTNVENFSIPNCISIIKQAAFAFLYDIHTIVIPDSVTSIEAQGFSTCNNLTSIIIPDSITSIGMAGFGNCYNLYSMTVFAETPPTLASVSAFGNMPTDCTIYVPHGKGDTYKTDSKWSKWASQIQELPE